MHCPQNTGVAFPEKSLPFPSGFHLTTLPSLTITFPSLSKHHERCLFAEVNLGTFECEAILECFAVPQYNLVTKKAKALNLRQKHQLITGLVESEG